jgi:pectin methylesterase-like acyl-CoA thioesterase
MNIKTILASLFLGLFALASHAGNAENIIMVEKGNAESFLQALRVANEKNKNINAKRVTIYLPSGTYDLGKRTLNLLSGHNVTIVGQGMDNTIIKNAPDVKDEGISKTATLLIRGNNTYLQDLTLLNAMDYYAADKAGRAVCIQDFGTHTICKRVKMLSHQDTYYTKNSDGEFYWEDSEIHGTVDFICGRGDVYFQKCRIVIEKRNADGTGGCVIAAPNQSKTFGMLFNECVIENRTQSYSLARSWGGKSCCYYVNNTLLDPARIIKTRFTLQGMNVVPNAFIECGSEDANGNLLTPISNRQTFYKDTIKITLETAMPAEKAAQYSVKKMLSKWRPDKAAAKLEKNTCGILKKYVLEK